MQCIPDRSTRQYTLIGETLSFSERRVGYRACGKKLLFVIIQNDIFVVT